MSHQPYVPNKGKNGSAPLPQQNTIGTSPYGQKPSTSPYGTTPSNVYAQARPTGTGYTINPVPTTYNPYGNKPVPPANNNKSPTMLPDFSQALDFPPPTNSAVAAGPSSSYTPGTATSYQYSPTDIKRNDDPVVMATAYPVNSIGPSGGVPPSLMNSSIYQGGPTNGMISEGNPTKCHKIDYEIKGHEMQLVEIELDQGEVVIGEAGAMMFMEDGIKFEAKFGDGSEPKQGFWKKLMAAGGRLMAGESLFITHFTNEGQRKSRVAFAAPFPGNIVPLNLANLPGNAIICQRDAFLCAALGTKLEMKFNRKIGSGLFGGEGFILQRLQGDGMAFVHACGTIIKRELRGERIRLDTGCLVAYTEGISFDVMLVPGLKSMIFGGEGLFLATLQGTGTVWMQSLPFSRMADRIIQSAPSAGGRRVDEGSMLTGRLGDVVNGDGFGFKLF